MGIDKGAVDAVFTAGRRMGRTAVRELARVLRPGPDGRYVMITFADAVRRLKDMKFPFPSLSPFPKDGDIPTLDCEVQDLKAKHTVRHAYRCSRPSEVAAVPLDRKTPRSG